VAQPEHEKAPRDIFLGTTIGGKYPVLGILGHGGMGAVYRSVQPLVDREVAIKLVLPNKAADLGAAQERFLREGKAIAKLSHPAIVTLHDFGVERDGTAYMVMELVRGRNLSRALRDGELDRVRVVELCLEVLEALVAAHREGMVHRDLKPENIMLLDDASGRHTVKVLDFGLAKLTTADSAGGHLTRTGMVFGTPQFMAPEQATGEPVDARTDLYALGVVLFLGLTGRLPFPAEQPLAVLQAHATEPPPDLPKDVPAALRAVVRRALAKRREDRYDGATAMAGALRAALEEAQQGPADTVPGRPAVRGRPKDGASVVLAATLESPRAPHEVPLTSSERPTAVLGSGVGPPLPTPSEPALSEPESAPSLLTLGDASGELEATAHALRGRRAWVGLGAGAALLAGLLLLLWPRPPRPLVVSATEAGSASAPGRRQVEAVAPSPGPLTAPPPSAAPPAEPPPAAAVRLLSEPAGAQVYRGDELLGTTPLVDRPTGAPGDRVTYRLTADGREDRELEVVLDGQEQAHSLRLPSQLIQAPARERPSREVSAPGRPERPAAFRQAPKPSRPPPAEPARTLPRVLE